MKQLLHEKIWFPKIDQDVKSLLAHCVACQANGPETWPDLVQMSPLPPAPWHTVHIDFCGPFPTGEYLLVVIDAYSQFLEVDIVHSTAAKGTILKLECIFCNTQSPYDSEEWQWSVFHKSWVWVVHGRDWNKASENKIPVAPSKFWSWEFMKPLTKTIRAACKEKKDWKRELHTFLLNSTTWFPLSEILFNWLIQMKVPQVVTVSDKKKDTVVRSRDGAC